MSTVPTPDLLRVRAALSVGLPPGEALATASDPQLAHTAQMVRLGQSLADAARAVPPDQGDLGAGPLLRVLALAERSGHDGLDAVDVVLASRHDALVDRRRITARSSQAVGTARLLTALPVAAWMMLVLVDPGALGFYATPLGLGCAAATVVLSAAAHAWSRRLVRRASLAAAAQDPLVGPHPAFDPVRAAVAAFPVVVTVSIALHPLPAIGVAAVTGAAAGRPRRVITPPRCSTRELIELLRMLLRADTGLAAALEHVAAVVAAPLDATLRAIARRLRTGTDIEQAFSQTGLDDVGAVVAVTEHWGVASATPLRLLSDAVRAEQQAAAELAAERVQLALVFPTTLLTLPAFVIAVVPPLVWTAATA